MAADVGGDVVEQASLLVSELVTNAVMHTKSNVEISVRRSPIVRVEVRDRSNVLPEPSDTGPLEPGGLGLTVVETLAARWGVDPLPDGKTVWFELDLTD